MQSLPAAKFETPRPGRAGILKHERGQGLVEFSLVLPLFLVLILAAVDFGWALRAYIVCTNAAREGARIAAIGETPDNIKAKSVDTAATISLTASDVTVTGAQGAAGAAVTVVVDYDYYYITPLGGIIAKLTGGTIPSPLPISSSATMRME